MRKKVSGKEQADRSATAATTQNEECEIVSSASRRNKGLLSTTYCCWLAGWLQSSSLLCCISRCCRLYQYQYQYQCQLRLSSLSSAGCASV